MQLDYKLQIYSFLRFLFIHLFITSFPSQVDFMCENCKSRNIVLVPVHKQPNAIKLHLTPCSLLYCIP